MGNLARGPDGTVMVGSTVAGTSNLIVGAALFHINGVNRMVGSLNPIPLPPLELSVSMAKELLRLRTQVQELQERQGAPPVSRSREQCQRRNAVHPSQTVDTSRASTFTRLGPLCRLDANGCIHLESRHRMTSRNEPSGDSRTRRLLTTNRPAMAALAKPYYPRQAPQSRALRDEGIQGWATTD